MACRVSEKAPEITACDAMTVAVVASMTSGMPAQSGTEVEERVLDGVRMREQQRALAEVVEQQRRQHERVPGQPDRPPAEVAHVGVQRLAAGDGQHDRAPSDEEAVHAVLDHEGDRVVGVERATGPRGAWTMLMDAEHGQRGEPQHHDRPEDSCRPAPCRAAGS